MANLISQLKQEISTLDLSPRVEKIGRVLAVGDGIAQVSGLSEVMMSEMVEIETTTGDIVRGVVLNLEEDQVGVMILGGEKDIKEGALVKSTNKILAVPAGEDLIGRVVSPQGEALDGQGQIKTKQTYPVEKIAPGVISRQAVNTPLATGIKAIDAMIPIGRGQRELIIGDRQTGKTAIVVDEFGSVSGMVTIEDILEHLFIDVYDEYGIREHLWQRIDDRTMIVSGKMSLKEFNEIAGMDIPLVNFKTIGGFIFHLFGKLPVSGDKVVFDNHTFQVEKIAGNRIVAIKVQREEADG